MDLGFPLGRPHGSQVPSRVEPRKSALLSSWKSTVQLPVGLTIGIGGFPSKHQMVVTDSVLVDTIESVHGSQVCLECTGISGVF